RAQIIFEWIKDNMVYLCDANINNICEAMNVRDCHNKNLKDCLRDQGKEYNSIDIWLSAEDIMAFTPQCCDSSKYRYFGDCEDYAILYASMLRAAGASEKCVAVSTCKIKDNVFHAFNTVKLNGRWEYIDPQEGTDLKLSWEEMLDGYKNCNGGFNDYGYVGRCEGEFGKECVTLRRIES
ncbi:MAG: transglutaminase domain-containing protein, partial [Candidatus Aenigmatarchaeota archaeon]